MEHRYIRNVSTLRLENEKCIGCGMCTDVCPHQLLSMDSGKVTIKDKDLCMECGACALNCPASAISVECGVGCATAILNGLLRKSSPDCGSGGIFGGGKGCC